MPLMPDCLVMKLMELGNTLWLNHSKCTATPQTLPWYTTAFDTKWRSIMQYVHFGYDTNPKIPKRTSSPAHQLIFPALNWNCRKRVYVQILPSCTPHVHSAGSWRRRACWRRARSSCWSKQIVVHGKAVTRRTLSDKKSFDRLRKSVHCKIDGWNVSLNSYSAL